MKKLLFLAVIALPLLVVWGRPTASGQSGPQTFVIVELTLGKDKPAHRLRVPVVAEPKTRKFMDDKFSGGSFAFTEWCPKDTGCEYSVHALADAVDENSSRVKVIFSFKQRKSCDATREFLVVRGQQTKLNGKCRETIKAYYD